MSEDPADIRRDFHEAVNMTRRQLERWLQTPESRSVGMSRDGGEAVGHASGGRILDILQTPAGKLDDDDHAHMRTVVGYVRRHLAQRPAKEHIEDSRWRYSLMNWGHDPLK